MRHAPILFISLFPDNDDVTKLFGYFGSLAKVLMTCATRLSLTHPYGSHNIFFAYLLVSILSIDSAKTIVDTHYIHI